MTEIHLLQQPVHAGQRATAALAGKRGSDEVGVRGLGECGIAGECTSMPSRVTCGRCRATRAYHEMDVFFEGPECGEPECNECPSVALVAWGHSRALHHLLDDGLVIEAFVDVRSVVRRAVTILERDDHDWDKFELLVDLFELITPDLLDWLAEDEYIPAQVYDWFKEKGQGDPAAPGVVRSGPGARPTAPAAQSASSGISAASEPSARTKNGDYAGRGGGSGHGSPGS
jgi:hypothetical protein